MNNMNPFQLLGNMSDIVQQIQQQYKTPQEFLMKAFGNQGANNPMINNLMEKAKKGNDKEVEEFARNFLKERGINFDEEFQKFMNNKGS